MTKDAVLEGLIIRYLKEKGQNDPRYREAEQAFEKAAGAHAHMSLQDRLLVRKGVVERLLDTLTTSDDPQSYVEALERFSTWLNNSLDVHRTELSRLLHPVFLHTYLTLIQKDESDLAKSLLTKYQRRLLVTEGAPSRAKAAELSELSGVTVKQHLTSNAYVKQLMSSKHTVRLTPYAYDLLIHFLHSSKGMLALAAIINQHINVEINQQAREGGEAGEGGEGEQGEEQEQDRRADLADAEAANVNAATVHLGLLKDSIEDRYTDALEAAAQAAQGDAAPAGAGEGGGEAGAGATAAQGEGGAQPAAKKPKKDSKPAPAGPEAQAGAAAGAPGSRRLHPGERIEPKPWMPTLNDQVAAACLQDIEHRAPVGPSTLPSCCLFTFANARQTMSCAAFSGGADKVAAGFADSSVRLFDMTVDRRQRKGNDKSGRESGGGAGPSRTRQQARMEVDDDSDEDDPRTGVTYMYGHTGPVHSVCFSHDSRLLFSASTDGSVRLWSVDLGHALTAYRGHLLPVWDVAAGPLGYHFVTGGADRVARVWSTDSTRCLRILTGHQADVDVVGWHPNCAYVATASSDRSVRLWDVASGTCVRYMTGLGSAPTSMALHPDGRHIAVGSDRGSVLVWDLGSARRVASFKAHLGPVWSLSYSRGQGSLLASGGADETVRLWSTHTAVAAEDPGAAGPSSAAADTSKADPTTKPYSPVLVSHTKSSSITALQFSNRNLLLAAGSFYLRARKQ